MDVAALIGTKKNQNIPELAPGDTIRVSTKIVESGKERIQVFQGVVIKLRGGGPGASFTVRHVAYGVGVERTFPFNSPLVDKVELVRHGKVRRAKLYYLRGRSGKGARIKEKRVERKETGAPEVPEVGEAQPEEVPQAQAVELTAQTAPEPAQATVTEPPKAQAPTQPETPPPVQEPKQ